MNNRGFIAISLIYSFFLVFLMTLLVILADYTHNRILLNDIKRVTQEELDKQAEFNPVFLENKDYSEKEIINYAEDEWLVISDNYDSVLLMLNRPLTKDEIDIDGKSSCCPPDIFDCKRDYHTYACLYEDFNYVFRKEGNDTTFSMCLDKVGESVKSVICKYDGPSLGEYVPYTWDSSVIFYAVNFWFSQNSILQKAKSLEALEILDDYTDNTLDKDDNFRYYTDHYIRIPTNDEYNDANVWALTFDDEDSLHHSFIHAGDSSISANDNFREIRPVIEVKKKTT